MALWEPLAAAVAGGVLAIGGVVVGGTIQTRTATTARREQHLREDRYRLHDKRVELYTAFNIEAAHARSVLAAGEDSEEHRRIAVVARNQLFEAFIPVVLVGTSEAADVAVEVMQFASAVAVDERQFDSDEWARLIRRLRQTCRRDLIPNPEDNSG